MGTNLSLPEETVADAHNGGLRPSSTGKLHLSPKSIVEVHPTWWTLTERVDRMMEDLNREIKTPALGFAQAMEDLNREIKTPALGFAQAMEDLNREIKTPALGFAQAMEDLGGELGLAAHIEDFLQQGVLDPNFDARSSVAAPRHSTGLESGVRETELVLSWLSYLRFVAPYIWNWIRNNPGTALWRLFQIASLVVGYQKRQAILSRVERIEDSPTESKEKIVTKTRVNIRVQPDSSSRIQDSRYIKDASIKNEAGDWAKVEYWDPRDGNTKTGWILAESLKEDR